MKFRCAIAALAGFGLSLTAFAAQAAEIKLLEGNALKAVMDELGPQFEKSTGNTIIATLGTSAQLKSRIESGEAFDAVLLTKAALDDLAKQGKVADAPRAGIAHAGIGVAIKKGAPKPDLSTVEAFKQAMLNANIDRLCRSDADRRRAENPIRQARHCGSDESEAQAVEQASGASQSLTVTSRSG